MAYIKQLKDALSNEKIYPITHTRAVINDDSKNVELLINELGDHLKKVTHAQLVDLMNNKLLVPGVWYRITDYVTSANTELNYRSAGHLFDVVVLALSEDTLSEEARAIIHEPEVYDITFDNDYTEQCYVYYNDDGSITIVLVESGDGWRFSTDTSEETSVEDLEIDDENKTVLDHDIIGVSRLNLSGLLYHYFQNSNLSKWKVWYTIDNDIDKYDWAGYDKPEGFRILIDFDGPLWVEAIRDESKDSGEFKCYTIALSGLNTDLWIKEDAITTGSMSFYMMPEEGYSLNIEVLDTAISPAQYARGVIYRLIDEWGNDCPYDFKNIQYSKPFNLTNLGTLWFYTFSAYDENDEVVRDATMLHLTYNPCAADQSNLYDCLHYCYNNVIKPYFKHGSNGLVSRFNKLQLNNICFIAVYTTSYIDSKIEIYNNKFNNNCEDILIGCRDLSDTSGYGSNFCENYFENSCHDISCKAINSCTFERYTHMSTFNDLLWGSNIIYFNPNYYNRVGLPY